MPFTPHAALTLITVTFLLIPYATLALTGLHHAPQDLSGAAYLALAVPASLTIVIVTALRRARFTLVVSMRTLLVPVLCAGLFALACLTIAGLAMPIAAPGAAVWTGFFIGAVMGQLGQCADLISLAGAHAARDAR